MNDNIAPNNTSLGNVAKGGVSETIAKRGEVASPELVKPYREVNRLIHLENKKIIRQYVSDYKKNLHHFLLTTRFNDTTWNENKYYRSTHPGINCIYCSPSQITESVPIDTVMFILEMNNDKNKIIGVGMVRNHPHIHRYTVYSNGNYNRYVFIGKQRIDRDDMNEEEDRIMKVFDILCFTGNKHMKRGTGLQLFPVEMLYRCSKLIDLVQFICDMFKKRLENLQNRQACFAKQILDHP